MQPANNDPFRSQPTLSSRPSTPYADHERRLADVEAKLDRILKVLEDSKPEQPSGSPTPR
jgi:hypothetical protein